jgi:predicted alpha/beta-hydrolase family hydrolase
VLLHGAGTDTSSAPLPELAVALATLGITAVRFDQPYRVAGRKAPDPARFLDAVLLEALPAIRRFAGADAAAGAALGFVGRSSGARVACRVAVAAGATAVACLGFPWQPPQGKALEPRPDRSAELRQAGVPVLVLQGERDPFGTPSRIRGVRVRRIPGAAHTPTPAMAHLAARWLAPRLRSA